MQSRTVKRVSVAYFLAIVGLIIFSAIAYFVWPVGITTDTSSQFDTALIGSQMQRLINEERQSMGLQSVEWDSTLAGASTRFAQMMVDDDFFDHRAPDGTTVNSIARDMGFSCVKPPYYAVADNLAQGGAYYGQNSEQAIASQTVALWMTSTDHRANILTSSHDEVGVGVAFDGNIAYIVLSFC